MTTRLSLLCLLLIIRPEGVVDNESSADILYYPTFQQMRLGQDQLCSVNSPLVGFGGMKMQPVGTITLPVVVGAYPWRITKELNFLVVDCLSSYNTIIGRPTLNMEGSNIYLLFISQIPYGVRDRANARRSVSSKRVLFSHVGYGQTGLENEHWRTVTSCIMVLVYGLINTIASRGNNNFRHFEENLKPKDEDEENT